MDRQVVATEKGNSAVPSDTKDNLNSDPSKMTLSRKIAIGLTAGIACGLFFGEICGKLAIIGNAYIAYPEFQVVLPFREVTAWPLGYATAPGDTEFLRFLDLWVELTRKTGFVSRLRDHWILGRTAVPRSPRWSVIRNVLHWVE